MNEDTGPDAPGKDESRVHVDKTCHVPGPFSKSPADGCTIAYITPVFSLVAPVEIPAVLRREVPEETYAAGHVTTPRTHHHRTRPHIHLGVDEA